MKKHFFLIFCILGVLICFCSGCSVVERAYDITGSVNIVNTEQTTLNAWMKSLSFNVNGYYNEETEYLDVSFEYLDNESVNKIRLKSIDGGIGVNKNDFINWYCFVLIKDSVLEKSDILRLKSEIEKIVSSDYILIENSDILLNDVSKDDFEDLIISVLSMLNIIDVRDLTNVSISYSKDLENISVSDENYKGLNIYTDLKYNLSNKLEDRSINMETSILYDGVYSEIMKIKYKNNPVDFFEFGREGRNGYLYADISKILGTDLIQIKYKEYNEVIYLNCEEILTLMGKDYFISNSNIYVDNVILNCISFDNELYIDMYEFEKMGWGITETEYCFLMCK